MQNITQKIKGMFFFALLLLVIQTGSVFAAAPVKDDSLNFSGKAGDYFHVQGLCSFATGEAPTLCPQGPTKGTDLCTSTWSCPGNGKDMLRASYKNGLKICVYLDNTSTDASRGYFVPMNTAEEWSAFSSTQNTPPDLRIVVGCPGGVKEDSCGNKYSVPDVRASDDPTDTYVFETTGDYKVSFFCPSTIRVKNQNTGVETTQPVVNCGDWLITETGTCVSDSALTFNGNACIKEGKPVEFVMVLDASASMDQLVGGARNALRALVDEYLTPRSDIPVTITVIGGDGYKEPLSDPSKQACPYGRVYGPLAADAAQINRAVSPVFATNNTPIDTTLRYSANFFQDSSKRRVMLVLSDGYETCFGDPALATRQLRDKGIEVFGIKYGDGRDARAVSFFNAMNKFSPANSQDEIVAAVEAVVKDVTEKSCKPTLRLYKPGEVDGDVVYTLQAGQTTKVRQGTYDMVVDYCTGKEVFENQVVENDRSFDFNKNCSGK